MNQKLLVCEHMALLQFRVQQFRSIEDSGWISCDEVTTLVGMNEAGKSNLLLALWKLNPAKGGEINHLADMPRRVYSTARKEPEKITFVEADFALSSKEAEGITEASLVSFEDNLLLRVSKNYAGQTTVEFQNAIPVASLTADWFYAALQQQMANVQAQPAHTEALQQAKTIVETNLANVAAKYPDANAGINAKLITEIQSYVLASFSSLPESPYRTAIVAFNKEVGKIMQYFKQPHLVPGVKEAVLAAIPTFVYYSNYGNLDSEIYLPHAIENMNRAGLTVGWPQKLDGFE